MAAQSSVRPGTDNGPPPSNTGVIHPENRQKPTHYAPVFDWYAATVDESPRGVVQVLHEKLCATVHTLPRPRYGYHQALQLRRDDREIATVQGRPGETHLQATGCDSPEVAAVVRSVYPGHRVTRADVAIDFLGGLEAWEWAQAQLLEIAGRRNVESPQYVDPIRVGQRGRTQYLGSPSSEVRIRLYEKALQDPHGYAPGTNRCEVQVRPQKRPRKALAATLAPVELAGYTQWTREALAALFEGLETAPLPPRSERLGDLESAIVTLIAQYHGRLVEWDERFGPAGRELFWEMAHAKAGR